VAEGVVYVATGEVDGRVVALDEEDGSVRWQVSGLGPLNSSPTVAGDTLYVGRRNGTLLAIDRHSGAVRWQAETGGVIVTSPTVAEGEVFIATGASLVLSFDAATGEKRWQQPVGGWVTTPVSVAADTAVAAIFGEVYFFDTRIGRKVFTFLTASGYAANAPVVKDEIVYLLLDSGALVAVELQARGNFYERPLRWVWAQLYVWGMAPQP